MPFVTTDLLRAILEAAAQHDADVVVPASPSPHGFEPFCAFYSARVGDPLTAFLEQGGGAAHEFISGLPRVHRLPLATVRQSGDPDLLFFSVNTAADLERARALAATGR